MSSFSPKFHLGFLLIFKQGFLLDLKSNSNEFGFIGFLVQSTLRGYVSQIFIKV